MVSEASYPYQDGQRTCNLTGKTPLLRIERYAAVTPRSEDALMDAVAQQPVVATVDAADEAFQDYMGGIVISCGTNNDHSVLVVGYNTQASIPYWIVQNSWGTGWGEHGYIRLAMGQNGTAGACGIAVEPSYPIVSPPPSASNVAIGGPPLPGASLTASYTYSDPDHLSESGSTYQWYTLSGSNATPIVGATNETYVPSQSETVEFCVTPVDTNEAGLQACSSPMPIEGLDWFSG
jgi:hypothetical protein